MTGVFDVIAHEDSDGFRNTRRATVAAKARIADVYGEWIRQDPDPRIVHLREEIGAIVRQACDEYGVDPMQASNIQIAVTSGYRLPVQSATERIASTDHESGRMPRMCPFHKDVTEISLNSSDPSAGFSAMAQHWGGPRHCEGEGYEGDSCKFKPQMTTQAYWDARQEKAEQRRQEREQAAELEAQQQIEVEEAEAEFAQPLDQETEFVDNVVEMPSSEPAPAEGGEPAVPMSMAAKTATEGTGLAGPEPKMDKSKWSPKGEPPAVADAEDEDSRWPTRKKDVVEPIKPENADIKHPGKLEEIGEGKTERQDVTKGDELSHSGQGGTFKGGPSTAVSSVEPGSNPILDILTNGYEGFTPEAVVAKAILAHKRA